MGGSDQETSIPVFCTHARVGDPDSEALSVPVLFGTMVLYPGTEFLLPKALRLKVARQAEQAAFPRF